jgi:superfamily I DNA/RNA helicase
LTQTISLNGQQSIAVNDMGHCAVVACPGSGKTRLLVEKVVRILEERPDMRVGMVTFTSDAAREISARLSTRLSREILDRNVLVGTFHKLSILQLKQGGIRFRIVDPSRQTYLLDQAIQTVCPKTHKSNYTVIEQAIQAFRSGRKHPFQDQFTEQISECYAALMEREKGIDFADILRLSVNGMKDGSLSPLAVNFLFVDEFQDTDAVQFEWTMAHYNAGSVINVVGDDDQSIYSFRESLGFHGIQDFLKVTQAACHRLTVNYRSRSEIVSLASAIIAKNGSRIAKDISAERGTGGHVTLMAIKDGELEQFHEIAALIVSSLGNRPPKHGEWAILARGNFTLKALNKVLRSYNIPTYMPNASSIWESLAGSCYMGLLKAVVKNETHGMGKLHKLAMLPAGDMEVLEENYHKCIFGEKDHGTEQRLSATGRRFVETIGENVGTWRKLLKSSDDDLIKKALIGIACCLSELIPRPPLVEEEKAEMYDDMLMSAARIIGKFHGAIAKRINKIERDEAPEEINAVFLSSMHGSKGLEWNNVVIANANDKNIPPKKNELTLNALEEERRLWYVAMTRAKDKLYIAWHGEPCIFIKELMTTQ